MNRRRVPLALLPFVACTESDPVALPQCSPIDGTVHPQVAGVFRYESRVFALSGSIELAQDGELVRVTDTTYDQADDRALEGEALLAGNLLDVELTPKNGDLDYSARVRLTFEPGGDRFCLLGFSDTNGDVGREGTYTGVRAE
jgi:hypothetical protein